MRPMYQMLSRVSRRVSLHMPATGGRGPFGLSSSCYRLDTTELPVTDDLYRPSGPVQEAEALAAQSAGAAHSLMLTGGGTAGIQTMLLYAAKRGDTVILPRNCHHSAIHYCAVAGIHAAFAEPSYTWRGRPYTPKEAYEKAFVDNPQAKAALLLRPDYYGLTAHASEVACIAWSTHQRGALLLCDEAHGSTFSWREDVNTALYLGADLTVQSAHKTLPALTAGAWLHGAEGIDGEKLRRLLRMVQTSSPSFLTMQALDDARAWMDVKGKAACEDLGRALERLYERAKPLGYQKAQDDAPPGHGYDALRLVLQGPQGGYALGEALSAQGIDMEMWDEGCVVGIVPLMGYGRPLRRLLTALRGIKKDGREAAKKGNAFHPPRETPQRRSPLHEATFAPSEAAPLREAANRISAVSVGLYPPGVALLTPGEVITQTLVDFLLEQRPARLFGLEGQRILCVNEGADERE